AGATLPLIGVANTSPNGTHGVSIVDSYGAKWTFGGNGFQALRDGVATSGGGTLYVFWNNQVWVKGIDGQWYVWNGAVWMTSGWRSIRESGGRRGRRQGGRHHHRCRRGLSRDVGQPRVREGCLRARRDFRRRGPRHDDARQSARVNQPDGRFVDRGLRNSQRP